MTHTELYTQLYILHTGTSSGDVSDFTQGLYNGAVVVSGQFGATSYVDFLVEVRDPPKYCSHCLGDSGECSVSTICNTDSDCNTITCNGATGGGTCGEVLPPYIYYARDANSPQSSCTSGTATNPPSSDCFVPRSIPYGH